MFSPRADGRHAAGSPDAQAIQWATWGRDHSQKTLLLNTSWSHLKTLHPVAPPFPDDALLSQHLLFLLPREIQDWGPISLLGGLALQQPLMGPLHKPPALGHTGCHYLTCTSSQREPVELLGSLLAPS